MPFLSNHTVKKKTKRSQYIYLILLSITINYSNNLFCQVKPDSIKQRVQKWNDELNTINERRIESLQSRYTKKNTSFTDDEKERRKLVYNPRAINYYFGQVLTNYVASPQTPATKEFTAVLKSESSSFEFGYTIDRRKGKLDKYLKHLVYLGFKAVSEQKKSFFTLSDTKDTPTSFGLDIRYTWVTPKRRIILKKGTKKKITEFVKIKNGEDSKLESRVRNALKNEYKDDLKNTKIDNAIAKEVINYTTKKELDYLAYLGWVNFGIFLPVNEMEYTYIPNQDFYAKENELIKGFRNWSVFGSANAYGKIGGVNGTLSSVLTFFNNNTILTEELSKKSFTNVVPNPDNQFLPLETVEIFTGDYDEFRTTQLKFELVTLLYKNSIGVSGAVEYNFGKYNRRNWKLGIPINLKDKDGKSTINFELQWRELNGNHFVGIRIGKAFGAFVN